MSEKINHTQGFEAYQEQVNIGLFNDIIAFVMATTAADTVQVKRKLSEEHLWYSSSESSSIQDKYGFRYFGELLERFEDKAGSDVKDVRAIALAMAYTKELFTDDMFVGNQKRNFLSKIAGILSGDIYLKGALYLLNENILDADKQLDELTQAIYTGTEELIFIISLYDEFEKAFLTFKPQLVNLLGAARTIPAAGNMEMFRWLIKKLCRCSKLKEIRTKDMAIFRAFMEIPVSFVKTGNKHNDVLTANGYTAEEIIYLNSYVIRHRPVRDTLDEHSIVAEKIAIEMCRTFINSENTHHAEIYEHLDWLMKKYESFAIKINGNQGIYQAIENDINLNNPKTFLWLYRSIKPKDVFRFDILDEKWDVLSRELSAEEYLKLFNKQLIDNADHSEKQITERIQKYDSLVTAPYLTQFDSEHTYGGDSVFALMVIKGIIELVTAFTARPAIAAVRNEDKDKERPPMLHYIRIFVRGIHNRESFDFLKYFFGRYNFHDMRRLLVCAPDNWNYRDYDGFFVDKLYKGPARNHGDYDKARFELKRPFLSDDEHRELFGWLDDYMLQFKPEQYAEFAVLMLLDPFINTLYPEEEFRRIYDAVRGMNVKIEKMEEHKLKKRFLTEAELQAERDAEKALEEEQKKLAREQELQKLRDKLTEKYDGSFKSLLEYLDDYRFSSLNLGNAYKIAAGYLETALNKKNYVLGKKELGRFMLFAGKLLKDGLITFDALKNYISQIKEEAENAENNRTPESDSESE